MIIKTTNQLHVVWISQFQNKNMHSKEVDHIHDMFR